MQNIYDVDEFDHQQDSSVNNIVNFLKTEPNLNCAGPASATDSTEPTVSYEGTEDDASIDVHNDDLESEASIIRDEGIAKQQTDIVDSDMSTGSPIEVKESSTNSAGHARCCQSNVKGNLEPTQRRPKKLRWGMIEMRLHSVIPGDHPDTREGPPLTMDWEVISEQKISIDGYEAKRPPRMKVLGFDLRMGSMDRLNILRRGGVKEEDITSAMESARHTRKQRLRTSETWRRQFVGVEELHEKIMRKLAKAMNPERRTKLITRY